MQRKYITAGYTISGADENKVNQDSFFICKGKIQNDLFFLAGVADGVGGLHCGEIASKTVTDYFKEFFTDCCNAIIKATKKQMEEMIISEIEMVNDKIIDLSKQMNKSIATTLTMIFIRNNTYMTANVGDSRIYLLADNEISQLTKDQTIMQQHIDAGLISEKDIDIKDRRLHTLTQAIGISQTIRPEITIGKLNENFSVFITSDGIINRLTKNDIRRELMNNMARTEKEKIVNMMKLAIEREEKDNLTGIIIKRTTNNA